MTDSEAFFDLILSLQTTETAKRSPDFKVPIIYLLKKNKSSTLSFTLQKTEHESITTCKWPACLHPLESEILRGQDSPLQHQFQSSWDLVQFLTLLPLASVEKRVSSE